MVVGCHGEDLLGMLLTHHEAVEELKYLWRWGKSARNRWLGVRTRGIIYKHVDGNFNEAQLFFGKFSSPREEFLVGNCTCS